ncbi:MAG: cytochrome P450 [Planctomycetota bacterium]
MNTSTAVYPDPDAFRPERFLERNYSPFEYLPFSGGHRRCIGAAFAAYEMARLRDGDCPRDAPQRAPMGPGECRTGRPQTPQSDDGPIVHRCNSQSVASATIDSFF